MNIISTSAFYLFYLSMDIYCTTHQFFVYRLYYQIATWDQIDPYFSACHNIKQNIR